MTCKQCFNWIFFFFVSEIDCKQVLIVSFVINKRLLSLILFKTGIFHSTKSNTDFYKQAKKLATLMATMAGRRPGYQHETIITPQMHALVFHVPTMISMHGSLKRFQRSRYYYYYCNNPISIMIILFINHNYNYYK